MSFPSKDIANSFVILQYVFVLFAQKDAITTDSNGLYILLHENICFYQMWTWSPRSVKFSIGSSFSPLSFSPSSFE